MVALFVDAGGHRYVLTMRPWPHWQGKVKKKRYWYFSGYACHPCAGAMLIDGVALASRELIATQHVDMEPVWERPGQRCPVALVLTQVLAW